MCTTMGVTQHVAPGRLQWPASMQEARAMRSKKYDETTEQMCNLLERIERVCLET